MGVFEVEKIRMKLFRLVVLEDRVCPETKWEGGKEHLSVLFNQVFLLFISVFAALSSALLFSVVGSALTGHSCANEMGTLGPHCTFGRQQQAWHPSHWGLSCTRCLPVNGCTAALESFALV